MANHQSIRNQFNENDEKRTNESRSRVQYQFELDIEIRQIKCLSETSKKSIWEVEWIDRDGPPIILVEFKGIHAEKKASYYVRLSSHPHIIRTYGLVRSNQMSTMFLQESPPQGNLSELLRTNEFQPNENVLWEIFEQICDGMIYLIDQNIVHGNLICQNILLFQINPRNPKRNLIKLTDFGLTNLSQLYSIVDQSQSTLINTISTRYAPPEFLKDLHQIQHSEKSDIYSMGILISEACNYGQFPYENIDDYQIIRQEKIQGKILPRPSMCSDDLWKIIQKCCHFEARRRPGFHSLKRYIADLHSSQSIERLFKTNSLFVHSNFI